MIDIMSHKFVIQEDETVNAQVTITLLQKIESIYPEKSRIHLFCDNARCYRNKPVNLFLETSRIKMHFLPPYGLVEK